MFLVLAASIVVVARVLQVVARFDVVVIDDRTEEVSIECRPIGVGRRVAVVWRECIIVEVAEVLSLMYLLSAEIDCRCDSNDRDGREITCHYSFNLWLKMLNLAHL